MWKYSAIFCIFWACLFPYLAEATEKKILIKKKLRQPKIFSMFEVVQFPNDPCPGSNGRNGTCYSAAECSAKGGTNAGTCASSYGVCCTFVLHCGGTSSQNCTYFESAGTEGAGACVATICPLSSSICQIRLDFTLFTISQPSTSTVSVVSLLNGQIAQAGGKAATVATECLTESFAVTNTGGTTPPVICGTNTGEHMYFESSNECNQLVFQLAAATTPAHSWRIKATQYNCNYANLAPTGCTEYFFGSNTGVVRSYNYNAGTGYQLANQNQDICIRRERGTCRICWTATTLLDFMVSGNVAIAGGFTNSACCGYGAPGAMSSGYDCVLIPSASKKTNLVELKANAFCGRSAGLVSVAGAIAASVCSRRTPFELRFVSDNYEFATEATISSIAGKGQRGFQFAYALSC